MEENKTERQELRFVSFSLGDENFGVDIMKINEIVRLRDIVKIPNAPKFIEGVINLRGQIVPILNIKKKFAMQATDVQDTNKIIVAEIRDVNLGILVDDVKKIFNVSRDKIERVPSVASSALEPGMMDGIIKMDKELIILLRLDTLLTKDERETLLNRGEKEDVSK